MEYNADLFTTVKTLSPDTKYKYELSGAFYHVFSDGDGDYHMAIEDKASLEERIRFFNLYLSKEKYPLYTKKYGLVKESPLTNEIFKQVLGLPRDCVIKKDIRNNTYRSLTGAEILSNIHFEEGLFREYPRQENLTTDILYTNNPANIGVINYLIENGFYILNPERVMDVDSLEENDFYPVHIDVTKVPASLLWEKETGNKLIMDFVDDPFLITKDIYLKYFRQVDSLSLEEMAAIAFDKKNALNRDICYRQYCLALKRYLLSMVRHLMNDFFMKHYHQRGVFGFSVLDHDFEVVNFRNRMVYQGTHYEMYSSSYREFKEENGRIVQEYHPKDYRFDPTDKKKIQMAFLTVKKFFVRHPKYAFIPAVFLRMMGLPYPALEKVRYFDFEHGTPEAFVSKLNFADYPIAYTNDGLLLTTLESNGNQLSYRNWLSNLPYYFKVLEKQEFFLSDVFSFSSQKMPNFLLGMGKNTNVKLKRLFDGDSQLFQSTLDLIENKAYAFIENISQLDQLKSFLLQDEQQGHLVSIQKLFFLLSDGYDANEAFALIQQENSAADPVLLRVFIGMTCVCLFDKACQKYISSLNNKGRENIFSDVNLGETFVDPYLEYPFVHKGRNFFVYQEKPGGEVYFDSKDKEALLNLAEIYHRFFECKEEVPYLVMAFGRELHYQTVKQISLFDFLGIPLIVLLNPLKGGNDLFARFRFKKGISMFDKENHQELLRKDYSLHYPMIFAEAIRHGVYLLGRLEHSEEGLYYLKEKIDPALAYYLDPEFIRIQMEGDDYNGLLNDAADALNQKTDREFVNDFMSVLNCQEINGDFNLNKLAFSYAGKLSHAYYQTLYHQFFHGESHHYLLSYRKDDLSIALGNNFIAYSKTGRIGSFGLLEKDIPLLQFAYTSIKESLHKIRKKTRLAKLITYHLGLPVVLQKAFYQRILAEDFDVDFSKLKTVDIQVDERQLYSYQNIHSMSNIRFTDLFYSTQVNHQALKEGMFVYPYTRVLVPELLNPSLMTEDFVKTINLIETSLVSVARRCSGTVKELLAPSEPTFVYYVKDFIAAYSEITNLSSSFLFYCQEIFIYGYSLDHHFLIDSINQLQNHGYQEYEEYLKKKLSSFRLNEFHYKFDKSETYQFFAFFLVYLEQQILYRISKKLR